MIRERVNRLNTDLNLTTKKVDGILSSIFDVDGQPHIWTGDIVDNRKYNLITNLINIALAGDRIEGDKITLDGDVYATEDFTLVGDAVIGGIIESWNFGLSTGGQIDVSAGTIIFGGSVAPKFSVDTNGKLTCIEADVSGKITVGVGSPSIGTSYTDAKCTDASADCTQTIIDGGMITTGMIRLSDGTNVKAGITAAGVGDGNIRIWAGETYANRATAPFRVTQGGAVVAKNITLETAVVIKDLQAGTVIAGQYIGLDSVAADKLTISQLDEICLNLGSLNIDETLTISATGKIDLTNNSELTKNHLYLTQDADDIVVGNDTDTNYKVVIKNVFGSTSNITFFKGGQPGAIIGLTAAVADSLVITTGAAGVSKVKMTANLDPVTGYINAVGGFKDNGVAGIDTTFLDADGNTISVFGGIVTAKTAP